MAVTATMIVEADIVDGDEEAAQMAILKHTLGIPKGPDLIREGDRVVYRAPMDDKFFEQVFSNDVGKLFFNDGPTCPCCGQVNSKAGIHRRLFCWNENAESLSTKWQDFDQTGQVDEGIVQGDLINAALRFADVIAGRLVTITNASGKIDVWYRHEPTA